MAFTGASPEFVVLETTMIFYTSDLHLGHKNIIKLCNRPFFTLEEMNDTLISNWNNRITNADSIYIVGDLMFLSATDPDELLMRLKGKKHLIIGNHDKSWMRKVDLDKHFVSIDSLKVFSNGRCKITLCHYPMMSFEGKYLIYGHIHNNMPPTFGPLLRTMENAINACVEVNNYTPATFDELIVNNAIFKTAL